MAALMLVARGGPTMMARIGVMRALNRHVEREFTSRKISSLGKAQAGARPMKSGWPPPPLICPNRNRILLSSTL
ncbi:hypothetical protein [Bradyrhizobium lablabi]|uniref:hypothetical protein n=1 Tax=Bradyrhizobium lablabi TaxID=722472 RepID=UPI0032E4C3CD